jgi:hypothetical protein
MPVIVIRDLVPGADKGEDEISAYEIVIVLVSAHEIGGYACAARTFIDKPVRIHADWPAHRGERVVSVVVADDIVRCDALLDPADQRIEEII